MKTFCQNDHERNYKMKKKILINTPDFDLKGGVASYYNTLKPLIADEADFLYTGSRGDEGVLKTIVRLLSDYIHFCKIIFKNQYELVILNPSMVPKSVLRDAIFLLISKMSKIRTIVFIHGWDNDYFDSTIKPNKKIFSTAYNRSDAFIVLADEFQKKLQSIGITSQIYMETTVIGDEYFSEFSMTQRNFREHFRILFLSRIEKAKGIYIVLKAYSIIKRKYPHITLTIAGDGSELEATYRFTSENNIPDVYFTGYVRGRQKMEVFSGSNCYLLPSFFAEGMPTSVLEAMAAGLPVITRPVGGLKDFFQNGKMGFLTESYDPYVFAEYIKKLVVDPDICNNIGCYNREYARNRFAASQVVKRLRSIFTDITDSGTGAVKMDVQQY